MWTRPNRSLQICLANQMWKRKSLFSTKNNVHYRNQTNLYKKQIQRIVKPWRTKCLYSTSGNHLLTLHCSNYRKQHKQCTINGNLWIFQCPSWNCKSLRVNNNFTNAIEKTTPSTHFTSESLMTGLDYSPASSWYKQGYCVQHCV